MNKFSLPGALLLLVFASLASCNNNEPVKGRYIGSPRLHQAWELIDGGIFLDRGLTASTNFDYDPAERFIYQFNLDGKLNASVSSKKTSIDYEVLPGDSILLKYHSQGIIGAKKADTSYIRQLDDSTLVIASRYNDPSKDLWVRSVFKKLPSTVPSP